MPVSVIIPTYNRAEILRKTLQGYAQQSGEHQILEVLVVDDGSKDHTAAVAEECKRWFPTLRYLHQENRGLAAARNHAIREATGDLLLFGDDDIIPSSRMVAEHVSWHRKHPEPTVGVLGYVDWAPEVHATPFMVWSGLYGPQFNFGYFKAGMELDFRYAYFCNTTLKSAFLKPYGGFNESFREYGWEDLELSYRLSQGGYRLLYNPEAVGYHYKYENFDATCRRIEKLHKSWPVFARTAAGKRFLELRHAHKAGSPSRLKLTVKKLLRPFKAAAMPLVRPLVDTRISLPGWLYDMVFYSYVTPIAAYDSTLDQSCSIDALSSSVHVEVKST